jgi:tetratricopeptide (TPR) repeat protein
VEVLLARAPIPAIGSSRKLAKRNCRTSHHPQTCRILLTVAVVALSVLLPGLCRAQTAETYRKQALDYSKAKSWDQAIANYREALKLEPNDALTHYNLALALKYSGSPA